MNSGAQPGPDGASALASAAMEVSNTIAPIVVRNLLMTWLLMILGSAIRGVTRTSGYRPEKAPANNAETIPLATHHALKKSDETCHNL